MDRQKRTFFQSFVLYSSFIFGIYSLIISIIFGSAFLKSTLFTLSVIGVSDNGGMFTLKAFEKIFSLPTNQLVSFGAMFLSSVFLFSMTIYFLVKVMLNGFENTSAIAIIFISAAVNIALFLIIPPQSYTLGLLLNLKLFITSIDMDYITKSFAFRLLFNPVCSSILLIISCILNIISIRKSFKK